VQTTRIACVVSNNTRVSTNDDVEALLSAKAQVSMRTYRMKWKVHAVDHSNQNITKKTSNLLVTQKQNVSNAKIRERQAYACL
jgi:hypothetical protein